MAVVLAVRTFPLTPATVQLYDLPTGQLGLSLRCQSVAPLDALWWSPNGQFLALADSYPQTCSLDEPGLIRIWNSRTGKEQALLQGHRRRVCSLAWGRVLASMSFDGSPKVWDIVTGKEIRSFPHGEEGGEFGGWSRDGKRLAALAGGRVLIWDVTMSSEALLLQRHSSQVRSLAWRLLSWDANGRLRFWDVLCGQEALVLRIEGPCWAVVWRPDGRHLAAAHDGSTVRIRDSTPRRGSRAERLD